jgi:biopolymer transport protein ExbD
MKIERSSKLMSEPPAVAMGDIAFILIVFFLVCISQATETGRRQEIPKSESQKDKKLQSKNISVAIGKESVLINGEPTSTDQVLAKLTSMLKGRKKPQDRVVVVKTGKKKDTPYFFWIRVTGWIEQAGGVITIQLEEEKTVQVK